MIFISKKRLEILEKRVADLEKQVQSQLEKKITADLADAVNNVIDSIFHIPEERQQKQ